MRAAALADMKIPKLCATDQLEAFGSCRLCLVQIEGMKGYPASCTTPVAAGMKVTTQNAAARAAAARRDGTLHLRSSARLPDLPRQRRTANCRTWPARSACARCATATKAPITWKPTKDESNPYFTFDPASASSARAACAPAMSSRARFALTIAGRGFDSTVSRQPGRVVPGFRMRLLRRLRAGLPDGDAVGKIADRAGPGRAQRHHHLRLLRRRLLVPRRDAGRGSGAHGAEQGRPRQPRPLLREGALRDRLCDAPGSHHQADDPRQDHRSVARSELGGGDRATRPREFRRIQAKYGRDSIGGITSSRCTNEETYLVQKLVRAGFGNNNVDTCARVCHSPTGYGLKTDARRIGRHAELRFGDDSRRDHGHRRQSDRRPSGIRLADEAAPAPGRQADRRRPAPHRSGAHAAHRGATIIWQLRPGTNVALINALAHVVVTEGLVKEDFVRDALRDRLLREMARTSSPRSATRPKPWRRSPACRRQRCAAAARLYADRRQRRHLLRPGRDRAQPGLDDGDGHRQSRHGHRQRRPRRRRRQSAARTEQRAGLLRHGLVPARVPGLPARLRRRRARHCSSSTGA